MIVNICWNDESFSVFLNDDMHRSSPIIDPISRKKEAFYYTDSAQPHFHARQYC